MRVNITGKGYEVDDRLKSHIEKKFLKLGKYFSSDIVAQVTLSREKERQIAEGTISVKGTIFRAQESKTDMYAAVDKVVDKLSAQMSKHKTKLIRKHKDHKEFVFDQVPDYAEAAENTEAVVKRKTFDLVPMDIDEAMMQMDLLDHNFFVFLNADSGLVNVLYKRQDSKFGLIEPKY